MNTDDTAGRKTSVRHIGSRAIAGGLIFSLGGCSQGAVSVPDNKILVGLAVIVTAFILTQIPGIIRDIIAAVGAITRALGGLALIGLAIAAAVTAAVFVLVR